MPPLRRGMNAPGHPAAAPPAPCPQPRGTRKPPHPQPFVDTYDPATEVFYSPKTLTLLSLVVAGLVVTALSESSYRRSEPERGVAAALFVFLSFHVMYGPTAPLVRPHPLVWRLIHGVSLVYLLGLVYLLFHSANDARSLIARLPLSGDLGVPLDERSYGDDCRIFTPEHPSNAMAVVWETINDEFFVAHFLGWFGKVRSGLPCPTILAWVFARD